MRPSTKVIGCLLLAAGCLLFLHKCGGGFVTPSAGEPKKPGKGEANGKDTASLRRSEKTGAEGKDPYAARRLESALQQIRHSGEQGERAEEVVHRELQDTAKRLLELAPRGAAAAILDQLQSQEDADTGLPFEPGEDGMKSWPTWRVFLLDMLGSINPKLAAEYARRSVFTNYDSADEWAIAMRSLLAAAPPARQTEARGEISSLLGRMLAQQAWRDAPTDGMFEAMDYIGQSTEPLQHLAAMQVWAAERGGRVEGALQMAAERAWTRQPSSVLAKIPADPGFLASTAAQRALRASLMARADLRQAEHVASLRNYLMLLPTDSREASVFFALFPNHRFGVSPGLAGLPILPDAGELRAADAAALSRMAAWASDPALFSHAASLQGSGEKLGRMLKDE